MNTEKFMNCEDKLDVLRSIIDEKNEKLKNRIEYSNFLFGSFMDLFSKYVTEISNHYSKEEVIEKLKDIKIPNQELPINKNNFQSGEI